MKVDKYQKRYLEHQKRKRKTIEKGLGTPIGKHNQFSIICTDVMASRRSQRIFNNEPISKYALELINDATVLAPSSCNRQAIYIQKIDPKSDNINLLVGGIGWVDKAKSVLFLYADMDAYKSPNEVDFMCYLDTGVVVQNIYLLCETIGLGCCYINPHLKIKKQLDRNNYKFMGAIALGYYDKKAPLPPKRKTAWKKIIG